MTKQLDLFIPSSYLPPTIVSQTGDGVAWLAVRDYGHRQEGLCDGTGAFVTFQSKNDLGTWGDWALINGGLIDRTAGREQGDLDMLVYIDGQVGGAALVGNMTHAGGPPAGLVPINDEQMNLGNTNNRWLDLFLSGALHVTTVGRQIYIDGQWQWKDCIPVLTQQGQRWLPVYTDPTATT